MFGKVKKVKGLRVTGNVKGLKVAKLKMTAIQYTSQYASGGGPGHII